MMSFLALNLQVAEASVAMHEMPIATAAKETAIRQAMAFPFLEDLCIGRTGHHAGVFASRPKVQHLLSVRHEALT